MAPGMPGMGGQSSFIIILNHQSHAFSSRNDAVICAGGLGASGCSIWFVFFVFACVRACVLVLMMTTTATNMSVAQTPQWAAVHNGYVFKSLRYLFLRHLVLLF
jgi:hypothetical protein